MLSRLFKRSDPRVEPVYHSGFAITTKPVKESNGWRVAADIEKNGKMHHLIRADVIADRAQAEAASLVKAKQIIDQMGERLFD